MPAIIKLSRLFYEHLGEQLANELVEVFNQVDATYRADLRNFNETNFARFDATLRQGLAEFNVKLEQRLSEFNAKLEQGLRAMDAKFEQGLRAMDAKLEQRLGEMSSRIDGIEARLNARIDSLASKSELEKGLKEQTRLLFLAWATLMAAVLFRG